MNWRSLRFLGGIILIILIVLLMAGGLGYLILQRSNSQSQSTASTVLPYATVYPQDAPPTPGPARTTYTNVEYGYTFVYPSEWKLNTYTFQHVGTVQGHYQVHAGGDGYPFDIGCQANPDGLDAQNWFKQNGHGTGIGFITLKSGVTAYLAVGHGQEGYTVYTLVHNHTVCQFVVAMTNQANNEITDAIVNSFKWQ